MGNSITNKYNSWHVKSLKGQDKIGKPFTCPMCSKLFPKTTTYNTMNNHVDHCLTTKPEDKIEDKLITRHASNELQQKYFNLLNNLDIIRIPYTEGSSILSIDRQNLYKDSILNIDSLNLHKVLSSKGA
jgi:hypothetical protein